MKKARKEMWFEKFEKQKALAELERRKKKLAEKRELYKPIGVEAMENH